MLTQRSVPGVFLQHIRQQLHRSHSLRSHAKRCNPTRDGIPVSCAMNIFSGRYSVQFLCSIVSYQDLPPYLLEWLVVHPSPEVRIAIADNGSDLPIDLLRTLLSDNSADVRFAMAENHNLPIEIIDALCDDENPYVAHRANRTKDRLQRENNASNNRSVRSFPLRAAGSDASSASA